MSASPSITRRSFLQTTVLAAGFGSWVSRAFGAASQPGTKVDFSLPPGSCDCHVHIFGDPARFAFAPTRAYTPEPASLEELQRLHAALGVSRTVVVQPSVYGTDNACMLDALARLGESARGVSVIDERTPESALDDLQRRGVRGIRLNLTTGGLVDPASARQRLQAALGRVRDRSWHIQIYTQPSVIAAIADLVQAAPVPIVFDHFGGAVAAGGLQQPGFSALVELVRSGAAYVKISGAADLVSTAAPAYADVAPLAQALVAANPQRILWATNWPHPNSARTPGRRPTDIAPLMATDDGLVLNLLPRWVPDAGVRQQILVDNPATLYGF